MRHGSKAPIICGVSQEGPFDFINGEKPGESRTFSGYGRQTKEERNATLAMLGRLARFMFIAGRRSGPSVENPNIPAGYTYLAQLLAHDMTFTPSPLARGAEAAGEIANLRSAVLDLDCIYGGGPEHSPWCYQLEGQPGSTPVRKRLRLGLTRTPETNGGNAANEEEPRLADIPRICSNHPANNLPDACRFRPYEEQAAVYEALIADPRNDDTLIVSQLVVLFHRLHNKIVDLVEASGISDGEEDVFKIARAVTIQCYRTVVVEDLLSRLLDGEILQVYLQKRRLSDFRFFGSLVEKHRNIAIPVEFTLGAWRVGHVMVRPRYRFNKRFTPTLEKLMVFNSDDLSTDIPITNSWIVDWTAFFPALDSDGSPQGEDFNASRLIRPAITYELYKSSRFHPPWMEDAPEASSEDHGGLIYRDLARGYAMGLPNGQALAETFGVVALEPEEIAAGLCDFDPVTAGEANPVEHDITRFSEDTPLLYYILREAAVQHSGQRLGKLGSSIVAEVILGCLKASERHDDKSTTAWTEAVLGAEGLPRTMPDLIEFVG